MLDRISNLENAVQELTVRNEYYENIISGHIQEISSSIPRREKYEKLKYIDENDEISINENTSIIVNSSLNIPTNNSQPQKRITKSIGNNIKDGNSIPLEPVILSLPDDNETLPPAISSSCNQKVVFSF